MGSFSDFVRHSERLVRQVGSAPAPDVVLLCRNLAQVKYFDGELMREVWRAVKAQIAAASLTLAALTEVIGALRELNAYDEGVFRAAAASVMSQVVLMSQEQRKFWAEAYRDARHCGDDDFLRVLTMGPQETPLI